MPLPLKSTSYWGPPNGINTKSYILGIEDCDPRNCPTDLESHMLGGVSQNLTDSLSLIYTYLSGGRLVSKSIVSRPAEELNRTYTITYPYGALWTPALEMARKGAGCILDFYAKYLCPENDCYEHFVVFPDSQIDPPVEEGDFITVDDLAGVRETSTMTTTGKYYHFNLKGEVVYTDPNVGTLHSLYIVEQFCVDCNDDVNGLIYIGGFDAGGDAYLAYSDDRGSSFADYSAQVQAVATAAHGVQDILAYDQVVVLALADTADQTAATTGEVLVSTDNGQNFRQFALNGAAMLTLEKFGSYVYAGGSNGEIWRSRDLIEWDQVSHTITNEEILDFGVDEQGGVIYVACDNGVALAINNGTSVVDISTSVDPGAIGPTFFEVHAFMQDWVAFVGSGGFMAESTDGGDTFQQSDVAGTTDDLVSVMGNKWRQIVGSATGNFYERSVLTNCIFELRPLEYGQAPGTDIHDIKIGWGSEFTRDNLFFMVYESGEVAQYAPCHPVLKCD